MEQYPEHNSTRTPATEIGGELCTQTPLGKAHNDDGNVFSNVNSLPLIKTDIPPHIAAEVLGD